VNKKGLIKSKKRKVQTVVKRILKKKGREIESVKKKNKENEIGNAKEIVNGKEIKITENTEREKRNEM
jgi:hypothetical protein